MTTQTQQLRVTPDQLVAMLAMETAIAQLNLQAQILATYAPKMTPEVEALKLTCDMLISKYNTLRDAWSRSVVVAQPADVPRLVLP